MKKAQQSQTFEATGHSGRDCVAVWRAPTFGNVECLKASLHHLEFPPHAHDTYVIGTIVSGVQEYGLRGTADYAGPGNVFLISPDEVHNCRPVGAGYTYRMFYPTTSLIDGLWEDMYGRQAGGTISFSHSAVMDHDVAHRLVAANEISETAHQALAGDEAMLSAFSLLLKRYAGGAPLRPVGVENRAVSRVKDYIHAHFGDDISLVELARIGGLSRAQLVRVFAKHAGMTPVAYLADTRVRAARHMLLAGHSPADVAQACGLCDQSHLNRLFKRRTGATPGQYRALCSDDI